MRQKILFLPSAWSNELVFQPQIQAFNTDYDIEVVDTSRFNTITETVKYIVCNYQNINYLVGLSLGGFAAIELMADYPGLVKHAVLIGTQAHAMDESIKDFYRTIMQQVEQGKLAELLPLFAETVASKASKNQPALMDFIAKIPLAVGAQGCINHHKAAISYEDQTHKLKNIRSKTLIICGEDDQGTPVSFHEKLVSEISNAKFIIVPNAGHFVTLEQPEIVNHHIRAWFSL